MDDLDQFVDDAVVNAFVAGLNVDVSGITGGPSEEDSRVELAQALLEEEDMLNSAIFGDSYDVDIKSGKYANLSPDQVADLLNDCELAVMLYPRNLERIKEFISDIRKDKQSFNEQDIQDVARAYIKTNI